ncbi:MAG TPA: hypothetical protein PKA42_00460 [Candidatus Paceibacterota bacterium]|nr:hypothetical protein [Candidatus Paceibacterota bacterium]HMO82617.1 hypothetical protein [Candidatus Paceibacterota bacterium]
MMAKYIVLAFCFLFAGPLFVQAQISESGFSQTAAIVIEPTYPAPHSTFSASLDDYSLSGQTTSISWKINGLTVADNNNLRTINLQSGEVGKTITIEANIGLNGNQSIVLRKTVTPTYLDIVVEPQTRTPAFYLGRGLPSIESQVNLKAIISGTSISSNDLIYTWQVNGQVIGGGPLRGRSNVTITVPRGNSFIVSLRVTKLNGEELIKKTLRLPSVEPEVYFYEKTALYGLNPKALDSLYLTGNSATLTAEPYYLALETYNQPPLLEWTVDNKKSPVPINNPYEITLARPDREGRGTSQINFHIRNLKQLLQGAQRQVQVNF